MNVSTPKLTEPYGEAWVCTDCYFAHHYGYRAVPYRERTRYWVGPDFQDGESYTDTRPLWTLDGLDIFDHTDSETGDGIHTFSSSPCDGCSSTLGGSRYRLALWERAAV